MTRSEWIFEQCSPSASADRVDLALPPRKSPPTLTIRPKGEVGEVNQRRASRSGECSPFLIRAEKSLDV